VPEQERVSAISSLSAHRPSAPPRYRASAKRHHHWHPLLLMLNKTEKKEYPAHLPPVGLGLAFLLRLSFRLFLNHTQQRITPPLQLLHAPALEEPVKAEHRKLRYIPPNTLVDVLGTHAVVVQPA